MSLSLHLNNENTAVSIEEKRTHYSSTLEKSHNGSLVFESWLPSWYAGRDKEFGVQFVRLRWCYNLKRSSSTDCAFCPCNRNNNNEPSTAISVHLFEHPPISIHQNEKRNNRTKTEWSQCVRSVFFVILLGAECSNNSNKLLNVLDRYWQA